MDFTDAITEATRGGELHTVLLGNGFSMDYEPRRFQYTSLWNQAEFPGLSVSKRSLAGTVRSSDFETVIRRLIRSAELAELYGAGGALSRTLRKDAEIVRTGLSQALADLHPSHAGKLNPHHRLCARAFLSSFRTIFTTNYDLLLYWVMVSDPTGTHTVANNDGFRGSRLRGFRWNRQSEQNVHYLHGALHLFQNNSELTKVAGDADTRILTRISQQLEIGRVPLLVAEGSSEEKRARIDEHPYLSHGY